VKGITGGKNETEGSIGGGEVYQGGNSRSFFHYADADGLETVAAYQCAPGCPVAALGEQSGELTSGERTRNESGPAAFGNHGIYGVGKGKVDGAHWGKNKGTAARFYLNADWSYEVAERLAEADAVRYQAKAGRKERDAGLDKFNLTPMNHYGQRKNNGSGGLLNGTGETLPRRNPHPTVKPIALTKWLATLLLPPAEYAPRRILVPFAGSGSEMAGALLAGWDAVVGVELEREYCEIAEARLVYWEREAKKPKQLELVP
jgi:hypothetical protein